jgi:hypothetical protein
MEKAVWLEKKGQQIKNYFAVSWTCGAGTLAKHTRMNLFECLEFRGQTDLTLWGTRIWLRFKGEFALATIGNDLYSGSSLLRS